MKRHELKTDPDQFQALLEGDKTFELRYNDRKFLAGDELLLRETSYTAATMIERGLVASYTGRTLLFDVVGVFPIKNYFSLPKCWADLVSTWVILSIRPKGPAKRLSPSRLDHVLAGMFKDAGVAGMASLLQKIAALILEEQEKPWEPLLRPARSEITPGSRRPSIARVKRVAGDDRVDVTYHLDGLSPEGEREVYKRVANYLAGMDTKPPGIKPDLPEECENCGWDRQGFKDALRAGRSCHLSRCPMMEAQEKAEEGKLKEWTPSKQPYPQGETVERFRAQLEPQDREFLINLAKYIKGEISEAILRQK